MRFAVARGLALALLVATPATAQIFSVDQGDKSKPLEILAEQGIEWRQNEQIYIARGNARATRGNVTVRADTLTAHYRPVRRPPGAQPASETQPGGNTEIYRVVAEGGVRIATETQTIFGDRAVYDVDSAVVVVTGKDLKLVTPRDEVTARDSLEWHEGRQLAVARGDAVAIREEKRVRADVLTAQVVRPENAPSRITRVDANGAVLVSTPGEIARGDTGVYNVDTGIVTLRGRVTITRGENTLRGDAAVVDLNRNVSRLLPGAGQGGQPGRVEGLIVPRSKPSPPER